MAREKLVGAGRYAYLLSDATFKVVVCTPEHEKLLIEILELLLPGKHIGSITFVNKEMHGLVISEKNVTFDLLCKDEDTQEEFLVEVQNREQTSFRDRTPVYVISMVNFPFAHEDERAIELDYISRYELRNRHNGELMTPSLSFVYLELDRLNLKSNEPEKCRNLLERFVFSMKYMHELEAKPECFEDELLGQLFLATELATMTVTERQNYDTAMRNELDRLAENAFARKQGIKEGMEKGIEKGEKRGRILSAKQMIDAGFQEPDVLKAVGLSPDDLASIK